MIGRPLDQLKYQVTAELLGRPFDFETAEELAPGEGGSSAFAAAGRSYEDLKFELAQELGVPLQRGYNGELTARQAGVLGGHIGGQMVRRLIRFAEEQLANGAQLPRG
ncbi:MAG: alpha/beta-type small acid-soluble spore protein [Clostridia bacterium]|nr:alpha/beta-type small acid-soluble spore protein [Clostridia bacterium]